MRVPGLLRAARIGEWAGILAYLFAVVRNRFRSTPDRLLRPLSVGGVHYELAAGLGEPKLLFETVASGQYGQIPGFHPEKDWVCLDVGANLGLVALPWAKRMESGTVHAFEPHPTTCKRFERNIALNEADGIIQVHQMAVGAKTGKLELFISGEGTMAMDPAQAEDRWEGERIAVPVTTLDAFCRKHRLNHIDLIKIDIEGYEEQALLGAAKTLGITRRLVVECHSPALSRSCREILEDAGFTLYTIGSLFYAERMIS
ncbi:MAG: FkbM family methyltransferase [bacterium]